MQFFLATTSCCPSLRQSFLISRSDIDKNDQLRRASVFRKKFLFSN